MLRSRLPRSLRVTAAAVTLGAALTLTGCGFDVQTLQPYTPAQGVNVDVANGPKVRNLLIIANDKGKGRLSASLVSTNKADSLTGISGNTIKADLSAGEPLTVGTVNLPLQSSKLVVLTDSGVPAITVDGTDLKPGYTAKVQLKFGSGAIQEMVVPIVSASDPIYKAAVPDLA